VTEQASTHLFMEVDRRVGSSRLSITIGCWSFTRRSKVGKKSVNHIGNQTKSVRCVLLYRSRLEC